ncbi:hypothetical protein [Streptomyces sp. NPDC007904]|uniref:hypothetical protein n=1 Tax=Streptomyces sp. NPDC007904 TaxID=3364787 RepID=UPI0036E322DD
MEAATGLPTLLFTAALVVVVCFWLLVAAGAATARAFDADADLGALGMGGVPVAVAFSLLTVFAWLLATGATALLGAIVPEGPAAGLLRPLIACGALLAAWRLTRLSVRPLHRLFRDAPGPSRPARGPAGARDVPRPAARVRATGPRPHGPYDRAAAPRGLTARPRRLSGSGTAGTGERSGRAVSRRGAPAPPPPAPARCAARGRRPSAIHGPGAAP